jgi:transcriptional regulator with XRE-family HTH domain
MFVNNYLQKSSQMTQSYVHNYTMSVIQDTKSLAEFVRNVMENKRLSAREVERKSGNTITHSYVNKIKNGDAKNPSPALLQALAKGIDEPEEIIFALIRGKNIDEKVILDEGLARGLDSLPPGKRKLAVRQMQGIIESLSEKEHDFDYGDFDDDK